jgi:hypothetical protein
MTTTDKPVRRETRATYRAVPLIIELRSTWLVIRQKGCRTRFTVTYDQIWTTGAQNAAAALRRERAEAKAARKGRK